MAAVDYGSHIHFTTSTSVATQFKIMSCRWVGATAVGHRCEMYLAATTQLLFESVATSANFNDGWVWKNKYVNGITTTMDSGSLIVYKDPS